MSTVDLLTIRLTWAENLPLPPTPHLLRGALAARFPDNPLFHQHEGGRVIYRYPRVQYRWDREGPVILGLGEAAHFLSQVDWAGMELRIGARSLTIQDAECTFRRHTIRPLPRLSRYKFVTPWLPFSQENYQRYRAMHMSEQAVERDRLSVAGLLIALRGYGVEFFDRLYAAFETNSTHSCQYKGVELMGFRGVLFANIDLPDGFALGRAVSHGYGWLRRECADSFEKPCHDSGVIADGTRR